MLAAFGFMWSKPIFLCLYIFYLYIYAKKINHEIIITWTKHLTIQMQIGSTVKVQTVRQAEIKFNKIAQRKILKEMNTGIYFATIGQNSY